VNRPEPLNFHGFFAGSCSNGDVSMLGVNPTLDLSQCRSLHEWLGLHLAAHDATKPAPVPAPVLPAVRRVPGCGEWVDDDKGQSILRYLEEHWGKSDVAASGLENGAWWAYPPEGFDLLSNGTAPGSTPEERLANAKRAAEDALIAEVARISREHAAPRTTYGGDIPFSTSERCGSCGDKRPADDIGWVDVELGIARCASCTPAAPVRHNSADAVPAQTAWDVACSTYPHAKMVEGSNLEEQFRVMAEQAFAPGQPVDAIAAEVLRIMLDRAVWKMACRLGCEPVTPAGNHPAEPEPQVTP